VSAPENFCPGISLSRTRADEILNTADALRAHVQMLAGTIGERNVWRFDALRRAAAYIAERFASSGYAPVIQSYDVHKLPVENIEAVLPGTSDDAAIVVVGAHYDSVTDCPGANDNATGVAATLELARRFAAARRARTIRFVAFVNEEPPFFRTPLMGSVVYANAAKARGENVIAMLSLETMGYYSDARGSQLYPPPLNLVFPDTGNFIGFVSNLRSARLLRAARRAFKARTSFPIQSAPAPESLAGVGWSDQWAFWQAGYPAIMITDTAPYRYPWYHTAEDTTDKINFAKLAEVVDGLEHVIHVLAGGAERSTHGRRSPSR
jgi:Zn-dependent M28 family amino/carboxypeptidase